MPMILQDIVVAYEAHLNAMKKAIPSSSKPRREFYHDYYYVRRLIGRGMSDDKFLYECVYNRDRHLWMMSRTLALTVAKKLDADRILYGKYADFEALYDAVRLSISKIDGIGDVAFYDIALRIGYYSDIYPDKYVYYHSYLRESIRTLLSLQRLKSFRAPIGIFSYVLPNMPAIFIEDFICSMHDCICPISKKYNGLKGKFNHPLTKYGAFSLGKLPAVSKLTINNYFLKP